MTDLTASPSREAAAAAAHRGFHKAWTMPDPLNLYPDSPVWSAIANAVLAALPSPEAAGGETERAAAVLAQHASERLTRRDDDGWTSSCLCGHVYGIYVGARMTIEDAAFIPARHRAHVAAQLAAAGLLRQPGGETAAVVEVRELWAIRWPDGTFSGAMYSEDGSDYAEQTVRLAAGDEEVVHRTETITRTDWTADAALAAADTAGDQ